MKLVGHDKERKEKTKMPPVDDKDDDDASVHSSVRPSVPFKFMWMRCCATNSGSDPVRSR